MPDARFAPECPGVLSCHVFSPLRPPPHATRAAGEAGTPKPERPKMSELTEKNFAQHLNTKFRVRGAAGEPVELELIQVKGYRPGQNEESGMERFSLFFQGPDEAFLPQATYALEHDGMGTHELFMVPIARNEHGFRYEVVFNYFRKGDD
jgi:hypothetical protein